jgi:hypothetical protein
VKLYRAVTASSVNITMQLDLGLPPGAGLLQIEDELIQYQECDARTLFGCTRGVAGTTAAAHAAGTAVTVPQASSTVATFTDPTAIDWFYVANYGTLLIRNTSVSPIGWSWDNAPESFDSRQILILNDPASAGDLAPPTSADSSLCVIGPGQGKRVLFVAPATLYIL